MPKPARQIRAILELFRLGNGSYSLRLHDAKDNYIAVKLAELIPDLAVLQLITPTDMKIFRFDGESEAPQRVNGKSNGRVDQQINIPDEETPDPMDVAMEIAEAEEAPAPPPKRGPGRPKKSAAERQDTCKRCGGSGQIQQLLEGGNSTSAPCHVCQGEGTLTRFGMQR